MTNIFKQSVKKCAKILHYIKKVYFNEKQIKTHYSRTLTSLEKRVIIPVIVI